MELGKVASYKFPGPGRNTTPVVGAKGLVTIMNLAAQPSAAPVADADLYD